jgi:H+/Cl- antiporter ClcA
MADDVQSNQRTENAAFSQRAADSASEPTKNSENAAEGNRASPSSLLSSGSWSTVSLGTTGRWYVEHTALFVSTLKWAFLGMVGGIAVGFATRLFLWSLTFSSDFLQAHLLGSTPLYVLLPLALPLCVFLIRVFAPEAKGHGTEAVIEAVHQRAGRVAWKVAPIKLFATVVTLAAGGSVGKEGPCAQIGAAVSSVFADILKLNDSDRRRLVICGISAGFAAVFGTPVSGALFGIEVLYLGRIEYPVLFPSLLAGIMAHIVCSVPPPVPAMPNVLPPEHQYTWVGLSIGFGILFGLVSLLLIESMRLFEKEVHRFKQHPYLLALSGGVFLNILFFVAGDSYSGLGTETIDRVFAGELHVFLLAFLVKIIATIVTLEVGGSGGIITPLFFIGVTAGAACAQLFGFPPQMIAAFGFISLLGASTNTPIAACVMGMEILPGQIGVYAALCVCTAYLIVGHRSVYPSQKLGFAKSAGLELQLDVPIGQITVSGIRMKRGSLTEKVWKLREKVRLPRKGKKQP